MENGEPINMGDFKENGTPTTFLEIEKFGKSTLIGN